MLSSTAVCTESHAANQRACLWLRVASAALLRMLIPGDARAGGKLVEQQSSAQPCDATAAGVVACKRVPHSICARGSPAAWGRGRCYRRRRRVGNARGVAGSAL